jgi:hypothetical protein
MRKVIIVAALAAAGQMGATACAENPTPGGGSTTPTPTEATGGADETSQVCAEAIAEGTAAATELAHHQRDGPGL